MREGFPSDPKADVFAVAVVLLGLAVGSAVYADARIFFSVIKVLGIAIILHGLLPFLAVLVVNRLTAPGLPVGQLVRGVLIHQVIVGACGLIGSTAMSLLGRETVALPWLIPVLVNEGLVAGAVGGLALSLAWWKVWARKWRPAFLFWLSVVVVTLSTFGLIVVAERAGGTILEFR